MRNNYYYLVPLSFLYWTDSLEQVVFDSIGANYLKDNFSLDERKKIYEELLISQSSPGYDFRTLKDHSSMVGGIPYSNEEIFQYLMEFKTFMENDEFKLLEDDRPPLEEGTYMAE